MELRPNKKQGVGCINITLKYYYNYRTFTEAHLFGSELPQLDFGQWEMDIVF